MKFSHWPTGDYPIFINPDIAELTSLATSSWDTIRVCVQDDTIALASGYGNTHESVTQAMRIVLGNRRLMPETYILYHEYGQYYFNCSDLSGNERTPYLSALNRYFEPPHKDMLRDLILFTDTL